LSERNDSCAVLKLEHNEPSAYANVNGWVEAQEVAMAHRRQGDGCNAVILFIENDEITGYVGAEAIEAWEAEDAEEGQGE
jgi:hypothetical protein